MIRFTVIDSFFRNFPVVLFLILLAAADLFLARSLLRAYVSGPCPVNGQIWACYHNKERPSLHQYRRFQNSRRAFQAGSWLFYQLYLYFQIDVPYRLYMP